MKRVLFLCVHNSGRSQMAEAFFNKLAEGKGIAHSAGTAPASQINGDVDRVMLEDGIDMWNQKPKLLTNEVIENSDLLVSMGCGAGVCPASFLETEDWKIEDPEGKTIAEIRAIRDKIKLKVLDLLKRLDAGTI